MLRVVERFRASERRKTNVDDRNRSQERQAEGENAPLTLRAVGRNASTVQLHDVPRDTEANA